MARTAWDLGKFVRGNWFQQTLKFYNVSVVNKLSILFQKGLQTSCRSRKTAEFCSLAESKHCQISGIAWDLVSLVGLLFHHKLPHKLIKYLRFLTIFFSSTGPQSMTVLTQKTWKIRLVLTYIHFIVFNSGFTIVQSHSTEAQLFPPVITCG